jgi:hypothetical protein
VKRAHDWLEQHPFITNLLAVAAFLVAIVFGYLTIVLRNADSTRDLHRLQQALCGTKTEPGLLPTLASAPTTVQTSALGHRIVVGARRASVVIKCPAVP